MKKGFFRRKAGALLGVDISDKAVRLVELEAAVNGYTILAHATQRLPASAVVDGTLVDLEAVAQAVAQAREQSRSRLVHAAVAVAGHSVITRDLVMEVGLDEQEMLLRVHSEAEQYVPYSLDDMAIDFQVQDICVHDSALINVVLAACLKEHVEAREAALAMAGLKVRVVDVEAFALARASGQSFASVASGYGGNDAQWAVEAQGMGVACGLALRSFD
ncbi:MAG: hypothetical protein GAK37_02975 [Pseudomonas sp.]|nr:MAG: hypothetical protein GAK37_02975 [Pseudomonas sp.]